MTSINAQWKGSLCLITCSFVWGMAFAAQSNAMNYIQPFTFVFLRSAITCLVLAAALPLFDRLSGQRRADPALAQHLRPGILLGVFLVMASALQQMGLVYTTPAKSGFVTALYIVIVPVMGIFLGRRVRWPVWLGVALSLAGLVLLCVQADLSVNAGDLFTLGSALVFSCHILLIDRCAGRLNAVRLSAVQFGTAAVIAGIVAFCTETPRVDAILACWPSLLYVAVFSGAVGYTLQMVGQKTTDPTLASLLMCLESVFAAVGGWIATRFGWISPPQVLHARELLGCALMLTASVVAQLGPRKRASP